jgi:WG containing repeat
MRRWRDLILTCAALLSALGWLARDAAAQELVIAARFESAGSFHKGVAPVLFDKRWGLIDRSGAWVVQPRYASVRLGGEGSFAVQVDGAWGYVDAKGKLLINPRFEDAESFQDGVAAVKSNGRWGYVRADGTRETEFLFLEIGGREGPYVSARDAKGWAVFRIGKRGPPQRVAIEGDFDGPPVQRAYSISDGTLIAKFPNEERMFRIQSEGGQDFALYRHFVPARGEPTKYVGLRRMSEGFAPASTVPNQWGYLHKRSGELLWPGRFQDASGFTQGFAAVKIDGKWGYIDRAGRITVQPTYDAAFPFRGNYAVVREGDKRGFLRLDPQGGISVFIPPTYEDASRFSEGLAAVKTGGRWGYISSGQPWSELRESGIVDIRSR